MDITFISDTHSKHKTYTEVLQQGGDVIVCCGDITGSGEEGDVKKFADWYDKLPYTHKILTAGNHDFIFEQSPTLARKILKGTTITYLENSEVIIDNVKFYGSPITPLYNNWAFTRQRGEEIKKYWNKIPDDTNVLITHGPPYGILDRVSGVKAGCEELLKRVHKIKPHIHAFGHIHESYGMLNYDGIYFLNNSLLNEKYQPVNRPFSIKI